MNNSPIPYAPENIKKLRAVFSSVGMGIAVLLSVTFLLQFGISYLVASLAPSIADTGWYIWALSTVPLYGVAAPLSYLFFRRAPSLPPEPKRVGVKSLLILCIMAIGVMYVSNYIGNILMVMFEQMSGISSSNSLEEVIEQSNPVITAIATVIIAPIGEELLFRKLIVDRTRVYGEATAVILSGLLFGLFHTNIFQFFYAFALGCFFAFIYIRTGKIRHTMMLHAAINFLGGVVAPFILRLIGFDFIEEMEMLLESDSPEAMQQLVDLVMPRIDGLAIYMLYAFLMMGLAIAGIVLIFVYLKKMKLHKGEYDLPRDAVGSIVYLNGGMMFAILLSTALTVLSIFS